MEHGPTWKRGADGGWLLPEHTLGWDFLAWCGYWLRDSKARTPWKWTLEQARFWLWFYALDDEGRPLHDNAVLQRLKGWGKDPMAAGGGRQLFRAAHLRPLGSAHRRAGGA